MLHLSLLEFLSELKLVDIAGWLVILLKRGCLRYKYRPPSWILSSGYIFEQNGAVSQMKLENIYIGKQAGKSSVGASNIAIGQNAYENRHLYEEISFFGTIFAVSGSTDSIAIGQSALGCDTDLPNAAVSNTIAIGRVRWI